MTHLDSGAVHVPGTTPYAWPYDGDLAGEATSVVVVRPRGLSWPASAAARSAGAAVEVAAAVSGSGGSVVGVTTEPARRGSRGDGGPALPGDADALTAVGIDGFYGSSLDARLRDVGASRLILVGFGMETSVHSTMRSANDRGYECLLVVDACLAHDPDLTPHTVSMIEMSGGIFGAVGTADAVVAAFSTRSTP